VVCIAALVFSVLGTVGCSKQEGAQGAGAGKKATEPAASAARGESPKAQGVTASPVGKVVSLSGAATATRASQPGVHRQLAVGADVYADDVVTGSADSRIGIVLHKNKALWSFGGVKARRVDASAAWKVAAGRGTGGALLARAVAAKTMAAGRHSEKEAAESSESALRAPAEAKAAAAPVAAPEPEPEPAPQAARAPAAKRKPARRAVRKPAKRAPSKRPARRKSSRGLNDLKGSGFGFDGGRGVRGSGGLGRVGSGGGRGSIGGIKPGKSGTGGGAYSRKKAKIGGMIVHAAPRKRSPNHVLFSKAVVRRNSGLRMCYERELKKHPSLRGKVVFDVTVMESGRVATVQIIFAPSSMKPVASCMKSQLRRIRMPRGKAGTYRFSALLKPE